MAYRHAAERPKEDEEPSVSASFRVRYRSWLGLGAAAAVLAVAVGLAIVCVRSDEARAVVIAGMFGPMVLAGFALYLVVVNAAEVELEVTAEGPSVRVVLRRRWGFLPAAPSLVFTALSPPTLETQWDEGTSSSRHGRGRAYRRARLTLSAGAAKIDLPRMSGRRELRHDVAVFDHAPEVLRARESYLRGVEHVRAKLAESKKEERGARSGEGSELGVPVGSTAGARSRAVQLGVLVAFVVLALLVGVAIGVEGSRVGLICSALALPVFGGLIATVATAAAHGRTIHLRREHAEHTAITVVHDYFLFGPAFRTLDGTPHRLRRDFEFRIERTVSGEDDTETYELVIVDSGRTLMSSPSEADVRNYAKRLGGRERKTAVPD